MLRNIFLVTLFIYSVGAVHWEICEVDSGEDQTEDIIVDSETKEKLPGVCWVCKWIVNKVKHRISTTSGPAEIKQRLNEACGEIGLLKSLCVGFVNRFVSPLIEEISTTDGPAKVCVGLRACRSLLDYLTAKE